MRKPVLLLVVGVGLAVHALPSPSQKDEEEKVTQRREVFPEPPSVLTADAGRLIFRTSPLSAKGLLSEQTHNALKSIFSQSKGATIVRLRGFVAGSGDVRRVQWIVSEVFAKKRQPPPVLTLVQVGALPLTGAQVVLESTAVAKKPQNPHGLAFISGQAVTAEEPTLEMAPLTGKSIASLHTALAAARVEPRDVLRVTCFMSSLQDSNAVRSRIYSVFPKAANNLVQIQRAPLQSVVECEAVARLRTPLGAPLRFLNPDGMLSSPNYSQVALIGPGRVVLSGAQLAFRFQEDDARLAFQRLERDLGAAGASLRNVAVSNIYPLSLSIAGLVRKVRFEFYDKERPPASTMVPFEDLPALDASFALDVIAVLPTSQ